MMTDKEIKKKFKIEASEHPEKYYPVSFLKSQGFSRKKCKNCGLYFWSTVPSRDVCGDPTCSGGFNVVSNNPAKVKCNYIQVWKKFKELLEPRGYKAIARYPVVARWNPTTDFVMASIAAFQPYVITGEVEPPAKKLIIPQFSLRFGDVDNVGITGSHLTGFVMIGQHMFVGEDEWNQEQAFKDVYDFITKSIGLDTNELTIHEDAWAGGGSFGPCLEFFSRGVELFNQVYTMFEQIGDSSRPLKLKVLDMGLGMERIAWFSTGTPNIYEVTFPRVLEKLRKITKVKPDFEFFNKFSRYSSFLNVDETDDIDQAWNTVAQKMGVTLEDLKANIRPMTAIYSIAEHSRTLLVAITDGGLPSNVGGGYNLRVILRRALEFIDEFSWDIKLEDVCEWHAEELRELFPELSEKILSVKKIVEVETEKFKQSKERARSIIQKELKKGIDTKRMLELYDSNGITPQMIIDEAKNLYINVDVPKDFYKLVAELHEKMENQAATNKEFEIDFGKEFETKQLYFDSYSRTDFKSKVLAINGKHVVLAETVFYPTSGGQLHDIGTINGISVIDVFKQNKMIVHLLAQDPDFHIGSTVEGKIDFARRLQLTQHHTATHLVNAAAREILGDHINQAGAKKSLDKAHLDVTHYQLINDDELQSIEERCNELIQEKHKVNKMFLSRNDAEKRYGMKIYQGGAVPGKVIRIVEIEGIDVEACGGTHVDNTSEIERIKILKSSKVQDGVIRIDFVAGKAAVDRDNKDKNTLIDIMTVLGCEKEYVLSKVEQVFNKWKEAKKCAKKGDFSGFDTKYTLAKDYSMEPTVDNIISRSCEILKTQPEHIATTLKRFMSEIDEMIAASKNPKKEHERKEHQIDGHHKN